MFRRESENPGQRDDAGDSGFWRDTKRLTWLLLALWCGVTFGFVYFAGELSFNVFGWPLSFWIDAQGALYAYVMIVCAYAWAMNRRERREVRGG
jgi:putative solute:sodium symporter small subunit